MPKQVLVPLQRELVNILDMLQFLQDKEEIADLVSQRLILLAGAHDYFLSLEGVYLGFLYLIRNRFGGF